MNSEGSDVASVSSNGGDALVVKTGIAMGVKGEGFGRKMVAVIIIMIAITGNGATRCCAHM